MAKIVYPQVEAILDHYEALIAACEEWRTYLEEQRPAAYRTPERSATGTNTNGRFLWDPLPEPAPPFGTPEYVEFAYNRNLVKNSFRTKFLLDVLEGEAYDRLMQVVDGLGVLESARKGEWV